MGHEQIWAPWRLRYIQVLKDREKSEKSSADTSPDSEPDCFICEAVADTADRLRHVVARTESSITILNLYPYNNGHLMVAPKEHRARLDELTDREQFELTSQIARMVGLLEDVLQPHGFNVGLNLGRVAGAGLPGHLHWHVVPRWNGDTNFMPVLASVDVIPQSLDALWEALTEELAKH